MISVLQVIFHLTAIFSKFAFPQRMFHLQVAERI